MYSLPSILIFTLIEIPYYTQTNIIKLFIISDVLLVLMLKHIKGGSVSTQFAGAPLHSRRYNTRSYLGYRKLDFLPIIKEGYKSSSYNINIFV